MLAGTRQFGEKWYLGKVVSRSLNQETIDAGKYFDGLGWEVYDQYQLREITERVVDRYYLHMRAHQSR